MRARLQHLQRPWKNRSPHQRGKRVQPRASGSCTVRPIACDATIEGISYGCHNAEIELGSGGWVQKLIPHDLPMSLSWSG